MGRNTTAVDLWRTGYQLWMLGLETQAVMTMRFWGMAGGWAVDGQEDMRMWGEKPEAFGRSAMASFLAAIDGKRPDQVMRAGMAPLRRKTRANAKRLARRGPKLGV